MGSPEATSIHIVSADVQRSGALSTVWAVYSEDRETACRCSVWVSCGWGRPTPKRKWHTVYGSVVDTQPARCTHRRWRALGRHLEVDLKPMAVCYDRGWREPNWPNDPAGKRHAFLQ